jgi:hypothetical protein
MNPQIFLLNKYDSKGKKGKKKFNNQVTPILAFLTPS